MVQHCTEGRVTSRAQPLKRHHLGGHQLGPIAGQSVKSGIAVTLAARAAGIGHDPDVKFFFQLTQCGLHQAHMCLATTDDDGIAAFGLFGCGWLLQVFRQTACVASL